MYTKILQFTLSFYLSIDTSEFCNFTQIMFVLSLHESQLHSQVKGPKGVQCKFIILFLLTMINTICIYNTFISCKIVLRSSSKTYATSAQGAVEEMISVQ